MKTLVKALIIILCISIFSTVFLYMKNKTSSVELKNLKKQNDSLMLSISKNNKRIDSVEKKNELLFSKNDSLKNKLGVIKAKAEKYKKEHEKDINYINSLSDNDVAELFADKFK